MDGLTNKDTLISFDENSFTISFRKLLFSLQFHPNEDVRASGGSGTSVT